MHALAVLALSFAVRHRVVIPPTVPAPYRDLYVLLAGQVASADAPLAALHPERSPQPVYAAELLPANCNRGEALLQPSAIAGVRLYLDRLQQLGIKGVTIALGYPLLIDRFPRAPEYLQFYRQVMQESRSRHMTVDIESAVMFTNSPFSPVQWDWSQMTLTDLARERHDMIAKIVAELAPDYLNLGSEPDTEAKLTTYSQLLSPATYAQYLGQVLQGIDRKATKIGTGIGTWDSLTFLDAELQLPIDFVSLHIYPLDSNSAATAIEACRRTRAAQKRIIIDEAWLFKMRPGETTGIAADTAIFSRDAFSFFAPLDQQFLQYLDDLARVEGVEFVSPFWSTYLLAYLPYNAATATASYADIVNQVNTAAVQNLMSGTFSSTGYAYAAIIAGQR